MGTTKTRIGRYVLHEAIGRGAMGYVYRAEDPIIHRTVAVKVLPTADGLSPKQVNLARERFAREGEALGRIDHPNIIRVFDVGEDAESCEMYIVMEFVSGPNLENLIAETRLDIDRILSIVGQLASGLDAAHARGIIHRDIKPSNILLTEDGTVKIADFGITLVPTSVLTLDMRQLGTPAYMSPEQVCGKALDSRADLFSLGVLTYELLAGSKPFGGNDVVSIAHAVAHTQPVPISVANPELPQALNRVMDHVLAKDPAGRFASGREFHEALLDCLKGEQPVRPAIETSRSRPRRRMAWAWVATAVLAAGWLMLRKVQAPSAPSPAPAAARVQPPPGAATKPAASKSATSKPAPAKPATSKPPASNPAKRAPAAENAAHTPPAGATAPQIAKSEPKPPGSKAALAVAKGPTADVTIRFAHKLKRGTLTVLLDGVAVFNEPFSKKKMTLIQTTVWDPLKAPAGGHTLVARVKGEDGTTYVSDPYRIEFPENRGIELRIGLKGDAVIVKPKAS